MRRGRARSLSEVPDGPRTTPDDGPDHFPCRADPRAVPAPPRAPARAAARASSARRAGAGGRGAPRFRAPARGGRPARHVRVHGDWAAAAWDQQAVLRAGHDKGVVPDLKPGALWSVTTDWPRLVDYALRP